MTFSHHPLPPPRLVPWSLKPFASAKTRLSYDGYGRMVLHIDHDLLKNITPAMLKWWFCNIAGDVEIDGRTMTRYHAWHPTDHIHWELARPSPNGGVDTGAQFRIVESFARNPDFYVNILETVQRLDTTGITLVGRILGMEISRLHHDFIEAEGGTFYRSTLTIGAVVPILKDILNPLLHRFVFTEEKGRAWLRHNVEEVGAFEHLLPRLYPGA